MGVVVVGVKNRRFKKRLGVSVVFTASPYLDTEYTHE
jgi:hypothetical protein